MGARLEVEPGQFLGNNGALLRLYGYGNDLLALGVFDVARNPGDCAPGGLSGAAADGIGAARKSGEGFSAGKKLSGGEG